MPRRGLPYLLAFLVLAAAILPYARTLHYEFVWDDPYLIGKQLDVKGPADLVRLWNLPFDSLLKEESMARTYFRPAVLYSLALDRAWSGDRPGGFHRTNVILYAGVCLFLWLFAWELSGRPIASALGTILFALHPTHPESVAFVSGRTDVQGALFLVAALWAAARYGPGKKPPIVKLLPAALLLLPGLYSKEIVLFGAPVLVLVLWAREKRLGLRDVAIASLPVAAACALYLATRAAVGIHGAPNVGPIEGTMAQILTSLGAVARTVPLLFRPIHLSARHEIVEARTFDPVVAIGLVIVLGLLWGFWASMRRRSAWCVPTALFAATLLPICYVRLLGAAIGAERLLFLPTAALAVGIALLPSVTLPSSDTGGGGMKRAKRRESAAVGDAGPVLLLVGGVFAVWFAVLLWPRVAIWQNEGILYTSMLHDSPESASVHVIAGDYYYRTRDLERTAYHYRRALELAPYQARDYLLNLTAAEDEMGEPDSAFVHIRRLIALRPDYPHAWYALGNLFVHADKPDSAIAAYAEALRLEPSLAQAENNMGAVYERQGKMEAALAAYRRALIALPGYQEATNNLRRLSAELGRPSGLPDSTGAAK